MILHLEITVCPSLQRAGRTGESGAVQCGEKPLSVDLDPVSISRQRTGEFLTGAPECAETGSSNRGCVQPPACGHAPPLPGVSLALAPLFRTNVCGETELYRRYAAVVQIGGRSLSRFRVLRMRRRPTRNAGRTFSMEKRGDGVPIIISESTRLSISSFRALGIFPIREGWKNHRAKD